MKELQIVSKKLFEQAQYILDQRAKKNDDERQIAMTTKSKSAFIGDNVLCSLRRKIDSERIARYI